MQRLIIAKYTLIEAHKRSLFALFLVLIAACLGVSAYAASLAMMDKPATMAAFYAATIRFSSVALLGTYLVLMETRNLDKDNAFIWLGLPVSRMQYLLQKVLAYSALVTLLTLIVAVPLIWAGTKWNVVVIWSFGYYCELLLVVALAILLVCLFKQALISLAALAAIYLFARSALEFYHHSSTIIEQGGSVVELALAWLLKICTFLVPKLEQFASAGWILHQQAPASWWSVMPQAALFITLLLAIAWDRLSKREF